MHVMASISVTEYKAMARKTLHLYSVILQVLHHMRKKEIKVDMKCMTSNYAVNFAVLSHFYLKEKDLETKLC